MQVRIGRIGQTAIDGLVDTGARLVEAFFGATRRSGSAHRGMSKSAWSAGWPHWHRCAPERTVGTPSTSAARRAATSFWIASCVGTSTLPPMWPHFFTEAELVFEVDTGCAPASIIAFISSKAFSTPPKPASASATIGAK
jgi:hypothetical protein